MAPFRGDVPFPDPSTASEDGLLGVGGDLSIPVLLSAYAQGIFPWSVNPVSWWSPDPRGILELNGFHASRSLRRTLRREVFEIRFNSAFREVMTACASSRRKGNWITKPFIDAYCRLHEAGHAHSVECWIGPRLVGGVYGVALRGLFAGESMFHYESDASKVALYYLVKRLKEQGFVLFDIQMVTPITQQLGAVEIPRGDYLTRLEQALKKEVAF